MYRIYKKSGGVVIADNTTTQILEIGFNSTYTLRPFATEKIELKTLNSRYFGVFSDFLDEFGNPLGADFDSTISALSVLLTPAVGGSGGDASAANQISQLNEAITTNELLLKTNAYLIKALPFNANRLVMSNPDVNNNYQTIQYYNGVALVKTVNLTYDSLNNVIIYAEV